jgi:hypothetical protein
MSDVSINGGNEFWDTGKDATAKPPGRDVMLRKKRSTLLSQEGEVGVKCTTKRGGLMSHS